ncbi:MAG: glycoside hydrolase family 16 protein [Bacteroidales bacterium]
MLSFFSFFKFWRFGKLPKTSAYERQITLSQKNYLRYEELKKTDSMHLWLQLSQQLAVSRTESGLSKKEKKELSKKVKSLRQSKELREFFRLQRKAYTFHHFSNWALRFSDDFTGAELDKEKWHSRWCVQGVEFNANYSPANELHVFTEDNIEVSDQTLKIHTRKEQITGLGFSDLIGFTPIERDYTTSIVNTGKALMIQYGKVEIKFRFTLPPKGVYHAFWLGAGRKLPHVNMLRIGEKLELSEFASPKDRTSKAIRHVSLWNRGLLRQKSYYILSVEWNKDKIEWAINGRKLFTAPNLINESMYVALSSGVTHKPLKSQTNAILEAEWVKVYQQHELS